MYKKYRGRRKHVIGQIEHRPSGSYKLNAITTFSPVHILSK